MTLLELGASVVAILYLPKALSVGGGGRYQRFA
jgi:hypothetical protein